MGQPALVKDLWLLRASSVLIVVGLVLLALAPVAWLNILCKHKAPDRDPPL